jgi:cytochrome c peroxidase
VPRFLQILALAASACLAGVHCGPSPAGVGRVGDGGGRGDGGLEADAQPVAYDAGGDDASGEEAGVVIDPAAMALLQALSPASLPSPPPDVSNRFADDPAAAHLGQELFFDPAFSGPLLDPDNDGSAHALGAAGQTGRVACSGCHLPQSGFSDTRSQGGGISLGSGWGVRKAPSLLDVGQHRLLMWDGRRDALYNQVFGPTESPLEMNSSRLFVAETLAKKYRSEYEAIFGPMPSFDDPASFPQISATLTGCQQGGVLTPTCTGTMHGLPGDGAEYDGLTADARKQVTQAVVNMGKAIGAYERLLTCGSSRFDQWVHGDASALDASEQRGAVLFVGAGKCVTCHTGPLLSDEAFHNVGLTPAQVNFSPPDQGDHGAMSGIAAAIADPLNTLGEFSDGSDGRLPAGVTTAMDAAFKTPMLRCVSARPAFMHTGQLHTLSQVVAFFNRGGDRPEFGASELHPLGLTLDQQSDLTSFLATLAGPGPDASLLQAP